MSYGKQLPILLFSLWLVTALVLPAQEGGLGGPVSGLVFDSKAGAIRPVLGVPGGAHLGAASASGLSWATVAPNGKTAVGLAQGRVVLLRRLADLSMSSAVLEEGAAAPTLAAWNASSDTVAVYWAETGRLQLWKSLNTEPVTVEPIDLSGILGRVTALAVQRSGVNAVFGVAAEGGGGVYTVSAGQAPSLVVPAANAAAIALAPNDRDLYVADLASQQVLEVTDFRGSATAVPVTTSENGTADYAGIALSAEGRRLYVVDKGDRSLSVFDLESRGPIARTALEFAPELLEPLSESGLFLLKKASETEPFQVLDGSVEPLIYFIPAAELPAQEAIL